MRVLGIDLGDRRTGIAVGDTDTHIATPIAVLRTPASRTDELAEQIASLAREQEVGLLVLGLPLNMDGSEGARAAIARRFADRLTRAAGLDVRLHDERLTSAQADWDMARTGLTHKQKKARRDALAAAALLGDFLAEGPRPG